MDKFKESVSKTIERYGLLTTGERALVALSGGPDSVALLLVLNELSGILALRLFAAHANHQLRGKDSDEDERFVGQLCRGLGIPLEIRRFNTRDEAEKAGENLEEFARMKRYGFLFELAQHHQSVVATGHTLNDQAETFLMKLIRGAGPGWSLRNLPAAAQRTRDAGKRLSDNCDSTLTGKHP